MLKSEEMSASRGPIADYSHWNVENKSASSLDTVGHDDHLMCSPREIDGCLARGFWALSHDFNQIVTKLEEESRSILTQSPI